MLPCIGPLTPSSQSASYCWYYGEREIPKTLNTSIWMTMWSSNGGHKLWPSVQRKATPGSSARKQLTVLPPWPWHIHRRSNDQVQQSTQLQTVCGRCKINLPAGNAGSVSIHDLNRHVTWTEALGGSASQIRKVLAGRVSDFCCYFSIYIYIYIHTTVNKTITAALGGSAGRRWVYR